MTDSGSVGKRLGANPRRWGGAAQVTASQLFLAGASYVVLAVSGRALDARSFAVVTAFYLLVNTVGRGLCSAIELHLTRAVAADLAVGSDPSAATRAGHRQTMGLLVVAIAITLVSTPLLERVFRGDLVITLLLVASLPGMAFSYATRGRLAGEQRYGRYSLSFATEAATTAVVGAVLFAAGATSPRWWVLAFALGPAVAVVVLLLAPNSRVGRQHSGSTAASEVRGLVLSVVILGCSQAVWNLGPVILTARLVNAPSIAAGFAAVAVVLRIPVLVFPAAQAVLLPVLTSQNAEGGSLVRAVPARWLLVPILFSIAWVSAAVFVVPTFVAAVFGAQQVPGAPALLLLAIATLVGGAAQLTQTAVVARGDYSSPAAGWALALLVLLAICALASATGTATAGALLLAVMVAQGALAIPFVRRRPDRIITS